MFWITCGPRGSSLWSAPAERSGDGALDYEFKLLWKNHLARSIKFTVGADGKFDNGIATANKLGSDRVIVPVQIIGDQDGACDKTAWKTEAFYGNPLTGLRRCRRVNSASVLDEYESAAA